MMLRLNFAISAVVIGDIIDALKKDMLCPQSSFACFRTWLKLGWGRGGRGDGGRGIGKILILTSVLIFSNEFL